jgi:hypothetical protein
MGYLEAVVRTLAAEGAPLDTEWDNCKLCGAQFGHDDDGADVQRHAPDCPWRRAREWVAVNPAG